MYVAKDIVKEVESKNSKRGKEMTERRTEIKA